MLDLLSRALRRVVRHWRSHLSKKRKNLGDLCRAAATHGLLRFLPRRDDDFPRRDEIPTAAVGQSISRSDARARAPLMALIFFRSRLPSRAASLAFSTISWKFPISRCGLRNGTKINFAARKINSSVKTAFLTQPCNCASTFLRPSKKSASGAGNVLAVHRRCNLFSCKKHEEHSNDVSCRNRYRGAVRACEERERGMHPEMRSVWQKSQSVHASKQLSSRIGRFLII